MEGEILSGMFVVGVIVWFAVRSYYKSKSRTAGSGANGGGSRGKDPVDIK